MPLSENTENQAIITECLESMDLRAMLKGIMFRVESSGGGVEGAGVKALQAASILISEVLDVLVLRLKGEGMDFELDDLEPIPLRVLTAVDFPLKNPGSLEGSFLEHVKQLFYAKLIFQNNEGLTSDERAQSVAQNCVVSGLGNEEAAVEFEKSVLVPAFRLADELDIADEFRPSLAAKMSDAATYFERILAVFRDCNATIHFILFPLQEAMHVFGYESFLDRNFFKEFTVVFFARYQKLLEFHRSALEAGFRTDPCFNEIVDSFKDSDDVIGLVQEGVLASMTAGLFNIGAGITIQTAGNVDRAMKPN